MFGNNISRRNMQEVDNLKWLANQFGWIDNPQDNADKICNAIHYYSITAAERIEQLYHENQRLKEKLKKENDDEYINGSTVIILKGHITPEQIINYIRENIDKYYCSFGGLSEYPYDDADNSDIIQIFDTKKVPTEYVGTIYFRDRDGNYVDLFYSYFNYKNKYNLDYYRKNGLSEIAESEYTSLCADYDYSYLGVLKELAAAFGGWINEIDGNGKPFYFAEKEI